MRKQSFESIRDQLNGNYGTRSKGYFGGQRSFQYKKLIICEIYMATSMRLQRYWSQVDVGDKFWLLVTEFRYNIW